MLETIYRPDTRPAIVLDDVHDAELHAVRLSTVDKVSAVVLRDVTNSKIYRVKPAEIIGRLKVTTIRPREIVFTVQEFGFERQETLSLAKQEVSP